MQNTHGLVRNTQPPHLEQEVLACWKPLSLLSQGLAPSQLWGDTVQPLCSAGLLVSCPALYKHGRKTPAEYLKSSTGSFNASA